VFLALALRLKASASEAAAKMLFGYSVLYLFLIFAMLLVDQQLKWV
jgi:heme O synthase-like polyprenyltransferase